MDTLFKRVIIFSIIIATIAFLVVGCVEEKSDNQTKESTEFFESQIKELSVLINQRRLQEFDNLALLLLEEAESQNNYEAMARIMSQQIFARLLNRDLDGIIELGLKSVEYADLSGDLKQRLNTRKWLAEAYPYFGDNEKGIETLDEAIEILDGHDLPEYEGLLRATRAKLLSNLSRNFEALDEYFKVIGYYIETNDLNNIAVLYNSIGLLYIEKDENDLALRYFAKANAAAREYESVINISFGLNNIALALKGLEKHTQAIDTLQVAVEFNTMHDNTLGVIQNYYNMSMSYIALNNYEAARDIAREGLRLSEELQFPHGIMYHSRAAAGAYRNLGDTNLAYFYATQSLEFAEMLKIDELIPSMTLLLSEIYSERNDFEKALAMFRRSTELQKELESKKKSIEISELIVKYQLEQKEAEFVLLRENLNIQKKLNRAQQLGLVLLVFVSFIIAGFLFKNYKNQKRLRLLLDEVEEQRNNISDQNKELNRLNEDRETLIGIIVHDLKNPLFSITGLIELIQMKEHDKETSQFLNLIVQSTSKMNLLINSLLDIKRIEKSLSKNELEHVNISSIIEEILFGFRIQAKRKHIEIVSHIQDLVVKTQVDYIIRICENLLSNAIKFSQKDTKIIVTVKSVSQSNWTIIVEDEGPGIPEKERSQLFKMFSQLSIKPTAGEDSTGVGLYTVYLLVSKLKGRIYLDSTYHKGARFVCELPVNLQKEIETESLQETTI